MELSPVIHVLSRAIIVHHQHILLCSSVELNSNFYFTPGGHIASAETAKECLSRELLEETGYDFTITRFLGCIEYRFSPEEITTMHCHTQEYNFFFEAISTEISNLDYIPKISKLEQHIDLMWIPIKDLAIIDLRPRPLKQIINLWLNQNTKNFFI